MATPQSVSFHTLGCKLNFSETSRIRRSFEESGYRVVDPEEGSDIFVLNTCSVTDFADRKCRKAIRSVLKTNPNTKIIIIGCYAQLKPKEISEIPGVDLVLGASEKFNAIDYIDSFSKAPGKGMVKAGAISTVHQFDSSFSFGDRTRSFLKIQDGCDYKCTFCTIPLARGKSRSDTIENIAGKAKELAEKGVKEIVLTGVNIGDFGKAQGSNPVYQNSIKKKENFFELIQVLDQVQGIDRFRISSIEPNLCSDEIIEFVNASERFVPHFHMPLQSGSDQILKNMRRRYKSTLYADRVSTIKSLMPHACIGVDVIVGFPGETKEEFEKSLNFLSDLDISYIHVFTYSERSETLAAEMPGKLPMNIRRWRNKNLRQLSLQKRSVFYKNHLGSVRPVLFEQSTQPGLMTGYTDNYIRVESPLAPDYINTVQQVRLDKIKKNGIVKAIVSEKSPVIPVNRLSLPFRQN